MRDSVRNSGNGGKTAYFEISAWYDEASGDVHLVLPHADGFHTTVNDRPGSRRGHPNLFAKLRRALRAAGVPYPPEAAGGRAGAGQMANQGE